MKNFFALFCSLLYVLFEMPKSENPNLTTEKCLETGLSFDVMLVAKVLITLCISQ